MKAQDPEDLRDQINVDLQNLINKTKTLKLIKNGKDIDDLLDHLINSKNIAQKLRSSKDTAKDELINRTIDASDDSEIKIEFHEKVTKTKDAVFDTTGSHAEIE